MNKLTCDHTFDMNSMLLSSPPQFRCTKCRLIAFQDEVLEYNREKVETSEKIRVPVPSGRSDEEIWLEVVNTVLSAKTTSSRFSSEYMPTALGFADDVLAAKKKRFN